MGMGSGLGFAGLFLSAAALGYFGLRTAARLFDDCWDRALAAPVIAMAALVALAELLSLAQILNRPLAWLAGSLLYALIAARLKRIPAASEFFWNWLRPWPIRLIAIVYAGLLAVALLVPPNADDGLAYHLPRIAHYLQQGSFKHFSSPDVRETDFPLNAETAMLWTFVFLRSDRLAALIPFCAAIFAAVSAAGLGVRMGLPRPLAMLAIPIALGFPQVAVQSTSVLIDIVAAWLVVAAACFVLSAARSGKAEHAALAALAVGLAAGVKPTTWLCGPGLALLYFSTAWRARNLTWLNTAGFAGTIVLGVFAFTMPHLLRNRAATGQYIASHPWVLVTSVSPKITYVNGVRLASDFVDTNDLPYPLNFAADRFKREVQYFAPDLKWLNDPASTVIFNYFGFDANDISDRFAWFGLSGMLLAGGTAVCVASSILTWRLPLRRRLQWLGLAALPGGFTLAYLVFFRWQPSGRLFCPAMLLIVPTGLYGLTRVFRRCSRTFRRVSWRLVAFLPVSGAGMALLFNEAKPLVPRRNAPAIWQMSPLEQRWIGGRKELAVAAFIARQPPSRIGVCGGSGYALFGPDFRNTVIRYGCRMDWSKAFAQDRCDMVLVQPAADLWIPPALTVQHINDYWLVVTARAEGSRK